TTAAQATQVTASATKSQRIPKPDSRAASKPATTPAAAIAAPSAEYAAARWGGGVRSASSAWLGGSYDSEERPSGSAAANAGTRPGATARPSCANAHPVSPS